MEPPARRLRVSVLAVVLLALLGLTTPVAARLVGADTGARPATATVERPDTRVHVGSDGGSHAVRADAGAGPVSRSDVAVETSEERAPKVAKPQPHLLVRVPPGGLPAHRNPWASAPVVGTVVEASRYYRVPTVAWVEEVSANGKWGLIELPYTFPRRSGWVRLEGLERETSFVTVKVDLSQRRLTVWKRGEVVFRAAAAIGRSSSPTPPGRYFVTDRVPFHVGHYLGSFAFGISGIQPKLPAGWTGGDQLAIHGTNSPSTIGTAASAGCVRVSEATLARLKPMLTLGTPVVIVP
jgi:hypothetical protein